MIDLSKLKNYLDLLAWFSPFGRPWRIWTWLAMGFCSFALMPSSFGQILLSLEQVKEKKKNAVIKIITYYDGRAVSYGSGFFVSPDGFFMTNLHVVKELFDEEFAGEIILANGERLKEIEMIRCSDHRRIDLCLFRTSYRPRSFFVLGPEKIYLGQRIYKYGHGGKQDFHFQEGFTVKHEGNIPFLINYQDNRNLEVEFIEVSIPIKPGDSGGPVFDSQGDLVGMSTLGLSNPYKRGSSRKMAISRREIYQFFQAAKNLSYSSNPSATFPRFQLLTPKIIEAMIKDRQKRQSPPEIIPLVQTISAKEALALTDKPNMVILDIRAPLPYLWGHLPKALNIPYEEKSKRVPNFIFAQDFINVDQIKKVLTPEKSLLIYGEGTWDWKAFKAAKYLQANQALGKVEKIFWLRGGIQEWQSQAYPIEKDFD